MTYKPISNYGIVGDMETAALIALDGSVDWLCLPRFDSPSVFGAILDQQKGGSFTITPCGGRARYRQVYLPDTNILVTRFLTPEGVVELTDFMPVKLNSREQRSSWLVRRVKAVSGPASLKLRCAPAFHYGGRGHEVDVDNREAIFRTADLSLRLTAAVPLKKIGDAAEAEITLQESQGVSFVLGMAGERAPGDFLEEAALDELEKRTAAHWRSWIRKCTYGGRWQELVHRSALLLELLTYAPTGAIIAAPTSSLPERIGGQRNWDYRYNWIRDAAYTVYALLRIGLFDEATRFMGWVEERCAELPDGGSLQTVYAIDGGRNLHEKTLVDLEGYCRSTPVRVGNDAYKQLQLDIYGALIDAVYLCNKYAAPITSELWKDVRRLVNWVADNWQQPDSGIWELRGCARQLVHSKMMCWVALDRGLRLAGKRSLPADYDKWLRARDQIYLQVLEMGWNQEKKAFVQSYGSDDLDASVLMMPLVFFMAPTDPKLASTVDAICRPVSQGGLLLDGMVYRYRPDAPPDGLEAGEGTFNVCTLWLIEALTRMGRVQQGHWLFEKMLTRANHLGLYPEETSPNGDQLGNFPQAFTHMGLISAAFNLNRALDSAPSGIAAKVQ